MGIVAEDVARVRAATDFVQVASEHIALRRVGRRYVGLCPFHAEKSPSFSVNAEEGLYYCFGCQAKGDVITFVREVEHLDFAEAVERLAARANIQLRYDDAAEGKDRQRRARLIEAMERAVDWYHERLLASPDAAAARGYLRSRGYGGETVRAFRIGWAPDEWHALCSALKLPDDVLQDTGLGFLNRYSRQTDAFRGRIMFPIFDASGKPVAFGGRILPGGEGPKYKNSPETPLYSKSRTLYALNWAKTDVVEAGEVVVCEGYTDVIGFFTAGLPRAVATCGTALADEHFRMLKNFARRVVLAYDADAAGQAAAERFYEWEQRYEVDIAVADLPAGADPGDVAREDPAALKAAVENARPFLSFRLERVLAAADLRTVEGRARTAQAALAVIAEHPNQLVRDQYVMQVADRTRIEPERLREMARGNRQAARPAVVAEQRETWRDGPEIEALRLALHHPETVVGRLEEVLFLDDLHVAAFRALASSSTLHEAIESTDPAAATLLQRLSVEETEADPDDVVALLADRAGRRVLAEVDSASRADESRFAELVPVVSWLKLTLEQLREPTSRVEASDRLVAWLVERSKGKA
ncbi:MAG TPA: DNA primase [Acidimicrobiales bacterium]|nr:DNA primase [Acidimicrobiales bacterium]